MEIAKTIVWKSNLSVGQDVKFKEKSYGDSGSYKAKHLLESMPCKILFSRATKSTNGSYYFDHLVENANGERKFISEYYLVPNSNPVAEPLSVSEDKIFVSLYNENEIVNWKSQVKVSFEYETRLIPVTIVKIVTYEQINKDISFKYLVERNNDQGPYKERFFVYEYDLEK